MRLLLNLLLLPTAMTVLLNRQQLNTDYCSPSQRVQVKRVTYVLFVWTEAKNCERKTSSTDTMNQGIRKQGLYYIYSWLIWKYFLEDNQIIRYNFWNPYSFKSFYHITVITDDRFRVRNQCQLISTRRILCPISGQMSELCHKNSTNVIMQSEHI